MQFHSLFAGQAFGLFNFLFQLSQFFRGHRNAP
jgi:hypothetical protein